MQATERKERPILFSGEMVRGLLDDRKTQTRRVIKGQPFREDTFWRYPVDTGEWFGVDEHTKTRGPYLKCPYGKPGDYLWVRETFSMRGKPSNRVAYRADGQTGCIGRNIEGYLFFNPHGWLNGFADQSNRGNWCGMGNKEFPGPYGFRWRSSIHMPRWASRILLEVTDVRVERVQDISEVDAVREGCPGFAVTVFKDGCVWTDPPCELPSEEFAGLWDSLNAKRGYPWESNCWVWVVEFKRVEGE